MAHKFNAKKLYKLDNEKRRRVLPPVEILKKLKLNTGDIMADIGCGIGYFSIPAAKIVGNEGKIYALDISSEMLKHLTKRADENSIRNIEKVLTEENNFKINSSIIDFAFVCNVLHETEDIELFLLEIKRILKSSGKLAVIEWKKEINDYGPNIDHRLAEKEVIRYINNAGLFNIKYQSIGEHFYSVTSQKGGT